MPSCSALNSATCADIVAGEFRLGDFGQFVGLGIGAISTRRAESRRPALAGSCAAVPICLTTSIVEPGEVAPAATSTNPAHPARSSPAAAVCCDNGIVIELIAQGHAKRVDQVLVLSRSVLPGVEQGSDIFKLRMLPDRVGGAALHGCDRNPSTLQPPSSRSSAFQSGVSDSTRIA